ncbi:MAG: hypothetical protein LBG73_05125 [Spirochaetaceae bacterium]|nr:hypothetical protein [Spirochaetaceae bacterium]
MVTKGIPNLYNKICMDLDSQYFIDWVTDTASPCPGMICKSVVWYVKSDRWYLEEANYDSFEEEKSTWYARRYTGRYPQSNSSNVMKHFKLEKEERLITTNGKERPVVAVSRAVDDWWNPANTARHEKNWLCIPLFSYKERHTQEYVLNDQQLKNGTSFYIPSYYDTFPGLNFESSVRFQSIQMIKEEHLTPVKMLCSTREPQMSRPFGLTRLGLELLMYHFYSQFNLFPELNEAGTNYALFKEEVIERIKSARS